MLEVILYIGLTWFIFHRPEHTRNCKHNCYNIIIIMYFSASIYIIIIIIYYVPENR